MSSRITVDRLSSAQSEQFWCVSPHATGFNRPALLERISDHVDWWGAYRSDDLVAAWPVCCPYGEDRRSPIFAYFLGPMLSHGISQFKYHRYWAIQQQAFDALIPAITETYSRVSFSLPVGFTDLRSFQWQSAKQNSTVSFRHSLRHTARIENLNVAENSIYHQMARNRKRDIAGIQEQPPIFAQNWEISEIIELHNQPLLRQGETVSVQRTNALERVIDAATNGFGHILAFRDPEDGRMVSVIVLIHGQNDSNNVLCVSDESWRAKGLTAWTTFQGIKLARELELKIFDFNGANSPGRAADKHSYGAVQKVYFNCWLQREE